MGPLVYLLYIQVLIACLGDDVYWKLFIQTRAASLLMCLKCELWSFNSLLLGGIPHTESVMYFADCLAYQTVAICISN